MTPPEVKEQCAIAITGAIAAVESVVADFTMIFEQSFEVLTSLQEDPTVQRLEIEARELQQCYDEVKWIVRTVSLTLRLAKLQEAKALKELVDVA